MTPGARRIVACLAVILTAGGAAADELVLATGGRAAVVVRVPVDAIAAERNAADELARYLGLVTGATFRVVDDADPIDASASIEVGPTRRARESLPDPTMLSPERWGIRRAGSRLFLYGGRPRGTLYAVYHFLEDEVGIAFWTPWEESIPRRPRLSVSTLDRTGEPAFGYRDVSGVDGPRLYRVRRRHNGEASGLPEAWGGREAYGPPGHVHTAFVYVPPADYFDSHPEYFSEIDGLRYGGDGQLCLSEEAVFDLVRERLAMYVVEARAGAERTGDPAPTLFDLSQNDWGRHCRCPRCAALIEAEGTPAAPWVAFVGRLATWAAEELPGIRIDTLAYHHTFEPPRTLRLPENVVLRVSALYQRDFAKPVEDPANADVARALLGWRERVAHLRVWDYAVLFGEEGELPFPNLAILARDLRWYRRIGVEGVYLQLEDPIGSDLWDLKMWTVSRLLEDPDRSLDLLVREFTNGYYGAAGRPIRAYLRGLERAMRRRPTQLRYSPDPADYAYLDARSALESARFLDSARRSVADDPVLARRVRHARAPLDRAILARWTELTSDGKPGAALRAAVDRSAIENRYRETWAEQAEMRLGPEAVERVLAEVDRQLAYWRGSAVDTSPAIAEP